jgi:hypothetical protein
MILLCIILIIISFCYKQINMFIHKTGIGKGVFSIKKHKNIPSIRVKSGLFLKNLYKMLDHWYIMVIRSKYINSTGLSHTDVYAFFEIYLNSDVQRPFPYTKKDLQKMSRLGGKYIIFNENNLLVSSYTPEELYKFDSLFMMVQSAGSKLSQLAYYCENISNLFKDVIPIRPLDCYTPVFQCDLDASELDISKHIASSAHHYYFINGKNKECNWCDGFFNEIKIKGDEELTERIIMSCIYQTSIEIRMKLYFREHCFVNELCEIIGEYLIVFN